jgi:hypothetical protein
VVGRRLNRRVVGATALVAGAGWAALGLPDTPAVRGEVAAGPSLQTTATAVSPQQTPVSPQPTPTPRPLRFFPVAPVFVAYYALVDGPRTMGQAISPLMTVNGVPAQYFEKARLEDRRATNPTGNVAFDFEYGLLVDEMQAISSPRPVGGERSTVTYATINRQSAPDLRAPVPPGGEAGGVVDNPDGTTFIPFSAVLAAAPGHSVPAVFWRFMNDPVLFPGGWLHDIGLPITPLLNAIVDKGRFIGPTLIPAPNVPIQLQAFQRTILTYDPANPDGFQTERANTGTDFFFVFPQQFPLFP